MRGRVLLFCAAIACQLAGCVSDGNGNNPIVQATVFKQASVVYHTGENIEITYYVGGINHAINEQNAIELLKNECGGAFRITNRTNSPAGDQYIDAVCVH